MLKPYVPDNSYYVLFSVFVINPHGNQFSKIINSEMVILTPITINNHFNNANYVTKVDHLCSERHTFNFLLKKVDFRDKSAINVELICIM